MKRPIPAPCGFCENTCETVTYWLGELAVTCPACGHDRLEDERPAPPDLVTTFDSFITDGVRLGVSEAPTPAPGWVAVGDRPPSGLELVLLAVGDRIERGFYDRGRWYVRLTEDGEAADYELEVPPRCWTSLPLPPEPAQREESK